jgi:hypothetical protein
MSNGVAAQVCYAVVDSAVADCTVSAVVGVTAAATPNCGLTLRAQDASNLYIVEIRVDASYTPKIYKSVGGTNTAIATGAAVTFVAGDTLSAVLSGTSIIVKRNGTTIVSVTDSTYTTQTKHGLHAQAPSGSASFASFDDFSIQP